MDFVRISAMSSQRFDPSLNRLSAKDRAEPTIDLLMTANSVATRSGMRIKSTSIATASYASSLSSSGSNVCGFLPSKKQDRNATTDIEPDVGNAESDPYLPKSKSAVARILHALDCRHNAVGFLEDSPRDFVPVQIHHDDASPSSLSPVQEIMNEAKELPFSDSPAANTICLTSHYDEEADTTYIREIIRPRAQSKFPSANVNLNTGGRVMMRVRGLDCMRNTNDFERELDIIQAQSSDNVPRLEICIESTNETVVSIGQPWDHREEVQVRHALQRMRADTNSAT